MTRRNVLPYALRRRDALATACASVLAWPALASAVWPERTISIVVPLTPGGGADLNARSLAQSMGDILKTSVVVDNKPGAQTLIAAQAVQRSPADGYTIGQINESILTLEAEGKIDTRQAFEPLRLQTESAFVLVVSAKSPFRTVGDIVAAARAQPEKLNYPSGGVGTLSYNAVQRMAEKVPGFRCTNVSYRGGPEMVNSLLGGDMDFGILVAGAVAGAVQSGMLRALAVTSPRRIGLMPQVPTLHEAGVPNYEFVSWSGYVVRAGTPRAITDRLRNAMLQVAQQPAYSAALEKLGSRANTDPNPEAFRDFLSREVEEARRTTRPT